MYNATFTYTNSVFPGNTHNSALFATLQNVGMKEITFYLANLEKLPEVNVLAVSIVKVS